MTERVVPRRPGDWESRDSYLMYLRHLAAYRFAQSMAEGRWVLDLGCGAGYGSIIIAHTAKEVVALDVAPESLPAAEPDAATIGFVAGDSLQLPLRDKVFDLVVSFQVIEHIWDETRYLDEIERVLTRGGLFILSTPNKALRLLPFQPPFNPYHVREYNCHSLKKALRRRFAEVSIWGLRGTSEIMAIERERLKRNPIKVYTKLIARKILPSSTLGRLQSLLRSLLLQRSSALPATTDQTTLFPFSEDSYSANDFWVDVNHVETSLDLIGVCRKR